MVCEFVSKRVLNKPQQTWTVRLCSVIIPLTIKVTECKSSCVVSLSAKWILTNFRKLTYSPLPPTRRHHASLLRDHCFIFPVLLKKICKIQIQRLTSKIPWAGQLILYLTVKFACSLPSFCRPASQTTVLPLCPIILRARCSLRASCTSFQRISTNWQQKWLCVLCLLCICVCVCGAGWLWCWQELVWFTAEGNPAWPSFQSVSLVTVAFRKLSENEGGKMLCCPNWANWEQDFIYEIGQDARSPHGG